MHLLNSLFLPIIGAAVLIPVIIHLIWRNKAIRVDFPAMRFLLDSKKPVSRWLRWQQLLLLLMRCLVFALLALMFARPYFSTANLLPIWEQVEKEIVIIFDSSASMQITVHKINARQHLESVLAETSEKSRLTLLLAGRDNKIIIESAQATELTKKLILSKTEPGFGYGNLHSAIRQADNYLNATLNINREIVIISDFQVSNWPRHKREIHLQSKARIRLLRVTGDTGENNTITQIAPPTRPGEDFRAGLDFTPADNTAKLELRLQLAKNTVAQTLVAASINGQKQFAVFKNVPLPLGTQSAGLVFFENDDIFPGDNQFYFVLNQKTRIRVLAINGEKTKGVADELFYLRSALALKNNDFNFSETTPLGTSKMQLRSYDIILLANVRGLDQQSLRQINELVQHGGSVIFAPGDKADIKLFNKFFADLAGCKLLKKAYPEKQTFTGDKLLADDLQHILVQKTFAGQAGTANFYQFWRLKKNDSANRILVFASGYPAVVESTPGNGKSVMLSFPLDSEWSDMPVHTEYLPFVYSLLQYCAPEKHRNPYIFVNDAISLNKSFNLSEDVSITFPDGKVEKKRLLSALFLDTGSPGIYTFSQAGRRQQVAVNIDRRESVMEFENMTAFQAKISTPGEVLAANQLIRAGNFQN